MIMFLDEELMVLTTSQEIPRMEPEETLPRPQVPTPDPSPQPEESSPHLQTTRPSITFCNMQVL
jgi:hypothetical protein